MLSCYPDYAKAPEAYVVTLTEVIAQLGPEMQRVVANPLTGIPARTKYLPTVADIMELVNEEKTRADFRATHSPYAYKGPAQRPLKPGERLESGQQPVRKDTPSRPHESVKPQGYWTNPHFDREAYERQQR